MAVVLEDQHRNTGSQLVRAGLEVCRGLGVKGVVGLGHPEYYARFGFKTAFSFAMHCDYEVPDDVFMVMGPESGYLRGVSRKVKYHKVFEDIPRCLTSILIDLPSALF